MFMPHSTKIDTQKIIDGFNHIKQDYLWSVENDYWIDYVHELDISGPVDPSMLTRNGHFWTIVPLIFRREVFPFAPEYLKNSYTVNLLMSLEVKPVIAIFSMLAPHSDIDPHIDTDDEVVLNTKHIPWDQRDTHVVKYHMGLDVHDDGPACLVVGDEEQQVEEGKLVAFDETITHYAYNHSSKKRGVLIVSYLHDELYDK